MNWHYIMIPNETLRLIKRYHKTRNLQLAAKVCDDLYKQANRFCTELSKEDKAAADKAAKLIARDYGEVIKKLEEE